MAIRLVPYNKIDFSKWDQCISHAINGIVYAYSWYLDITANKWDALIDEDYKAVFPLVNDRKFGINYLYQPYFTQQLGIFSGSTLDPKKTSEFLDAIPSKYRYIKINFNTYNELKGVRDDMLKKITYQLDLIQPYHQLSARYNDNTRRNISRSMALGVVIIKGMATDDFIRFKRDNSVKPLKSEHIVMMKRIITHAVTMGIGEIYAAYTSDNKLCAAAFFIRSNGKVIYLFAASDEMGKENRAMFRLVDHFINTYSEKKLILDFEGSSIDSVARFYSGFGAVPCTYPQLILNKLPFVLKPFFR